jgi:hypothetical protein
MRLNAEVKVLMRKFRPEWSYIFLSAKSSTATVTW